LRVCPRFRQAVARPIYLISLILDVASVALALFIDVNGSSFDRGVVEVLVWQMEGISLPPSDAATKSVTDFSKPVPASLRLRHALALPLYTVSLLLDFVSAALGRLAAWVAGDDWPG